MSRCDGASAAVSFAVENEQRVGYVAQRIDLHTPDGAAVDRPCSAEAQRDGDSARAEFFLYRPLCLQSGLSGLLGVFVTSLGVVIVGTNAIQLVWGSLAISLPTGYQ